MKFIAVDLDGTLAEYHGWKGPTVIGEPIKPIMDKVREEIAKGNKITIFTARAHCPDAKFHIQKWLYKHKLPQLDITNIKRIEFQEFWDDRAIQVVKNKGIMIGELK